jgi:pyrimidine operon attenuation protein/uracil phosphoribosyltransferase
VTVRPTGESVKPDRRSLLGFTRSTSFNDPSREAGKEVHSVTTVPDPGAQGAHFPAEQPPAPRSILNSGDVARIIDRIAHQILEKTDGARDAVVLGIPTRGAHLARRLVGRIRTFEDVDLAVGSLDVTLYRDDLRLRGVRPLEETQLPDVGIDGRLVVLVDDVLFSGRTVRAALDALGDIGRPRAVQLAVLVDRGHRELPIRADYVGKNIPTSLAESVRVRLSESDGRDCVELDPPGGPR